MSLVGVAPTLAVLVRVDRCPCARIVIFLSSLNRRSGWSGDQVARTKSAITAGTAGLHDTLAFADFAKHRVRSLAAALQLRFGVEWHDYGYDVGEPVATGNSRAAVRKNLGLS